MSVSGSPQATDGVDVAFPLGTGAWTTWVPTLTNLTLGNGTVVAAYTRIGRTIHFMFSFTLGSTSAVGTEPTFTLPVTASSRFTASGDLPFGNVVLLDAATKAWDGTLRVSSGGVAKVSALRTDEASGSSNAITATVPFTWGTSDAILATGQYEAAA